VPLAISISIQKNETTKFTPLGIKVISKGKDGSQSKRNGKLYTNPTNTSNGDHEGVLREKGK
jgi:hypothetical protein